MNDQAKIKILNNFLIKNRKIIAWRIIDNQAVVINLKEETFNVLNSEGTRIWRLVDGETTVNEIIEKTCREYKINRNRVEKKCMEFIKEMQDKKLIVLSCYTEGGD